MSDIRSYREPDSDELISIANEAFGDEIERGMSPFSQDTFSRWAQRRGCAITVAEKDGDVVGFMILTEGSIEAPAQIQLMGVEKSQRGRGIGKELVKSAVAHVSSLKQVKLKLFTRPWNIGMSKVCIELGFIPEAHLKKDYLGEDLVLYSYFIL